MRAPSGAQATPHGESPTVIVESIARVRVLTSVTASASKRVTTASASAPVQAGLASARATRHVPFVQVSPPLQGSPSSHSADVVQVGGSVEVDVLLVEVVVVTGSVEDVATVVDVVLDVVLVVATAPLQQTAPVVRPGLN